jgi:ubiquitin thioesterase OTU1
MANLRLRHPKGVATITVDLDNATVLDLQHIVFSATEIIPSRQECAYIPSTPGSLNPTNGTTVKCGYPPRTLMLIPELPVSSLGIEKGDQLMVNELKESPASITQTPTSPSQLEAIPGILSDAQGSGLPDSVPVSGGTLVHRVNHYPTPLTPEVLKP